MQQITISGTLLEDAVVCTDKNQHTYTRFKVTCGEYDVLNRLQYTIYYCTCYLPNLNNLKKGDQVFVTGKFSAKIITGDDGKPYLRLNVMVLQASGGYKKKDNAEKA